MSDLLVALGLSINITSDKGGWTVLSGQTGTVALHSAADSATGARTGQTNLSFEETALEDLARQLGERGFGNDSHPEESMLYDEAYGRAITITLEDNDLVINGTSDDLYGYSSTGVEPGVGDLRVAPIRFVDDPAPERRLLEALGFSLVGEASEYFTQLALPGAGGSVGLHHTRGRIPVVPAPFAVQLTFETTTPLAEIIQRATTVCAESTLVESEFGDHVTVIDPDGQQIQIHAVSA